jgi:hypothetical protein
VSDRALVAAWFVVAGLIWCVVFDLYVSRGAHEYLRAAAEAELGRAESPSMFYLMNWTKQRGARAASTWALVVFGAGCATVYLRRRRSNRS